MIVLKSNSISVSFAPAIPANGNATATAKAQPPSGRVVAVAINSVPEGAPAPGSQTAVVTSNPAMKCSAAVTNSDPVHDASQLASANCGEATVSSLSFSSSCGGVAAEQTASQEQPSEPRVESRTLRPDPQDSISKILSMRSLPYSPVPHLSANGDGDSDDRSSTQQANENNLGHLISPLMTG